VGWYGRLRRLGLDNFDNLITFDLQPFGRITFDLKGLPIERGSNPNRGGSKADQKRIKSGSKADQRRIRGEPNPNRSRNVAEPTSPANAKNRENCPIFHAFHLTFQKN
jgi:hypothetical protein